MKKENHNQMKPKQKLRKLNSETLQKILKGYYYKLKNPTTQYGISLDGTPKKEGLNELTDKFSKNYYKKQGFTKEDKPWLIENYKKVVDRIEKQENPVETNYNEVAPGFEQYVKMSPESLEKHLAAKKKFNEKK